MTTTQPITSFKCLTFDCYGTLVDWETGIYRGLQPLIDQLPDSHVLKNDRLSLLKRYQVHEGMVLQAAPQALYKVVLGEAYLSLALDLNVQAPDEAKARFGNSVGDWPVYPDTVEALKRLHKHYKLVILSNVDRDLFQNTLDKQLVGIQFDAIFTAQDIGSYKPDLGNFRYLIQHCEQDLGIQKAEILHTAQSLHHDHVPAKQIGLTSAWIERGEGIESVMGGDHQAFVGRVSYSWKFKSLGEMADAVDVASASA